MDMADLNAPLENMSSYIYTALRNRVIDALRTRKNTGSLDEPGAVDEMALKGLINEGDRADSAMEKKEYYGQIYKAMEGLNDEEKAIIIATDFEGMTFRELSEEWGVPIGTLLSRKKRALDKIKNIFTKGGNENA
jgi:RNA polymerase sigma-70 factor (ECF subfamily)